MVVLSSRPPDWSKERFTTWWRGEHADAAAKLPGLIAYRHGVVVKDYDAKEGEADEGWDGHAVLTFADRAALDTAFASPEWAAAVAQTKGMKGGRLILLCDEVDLLEMKLGVPSGSAR